ncbi:translation initiation factor eIF-5 [Babesia microti strain RI]|uniref:Translation initiation factor eIF-5 n=1 Tax=Babesia microti (strain RI) TaxID=1133968 RepID=A0A1R4AAA9_BABMR|nr:translation initiation factor eIF-5 [Babesia microti strain RI]SJK85923.1 translation initiation factor eIF-5 [Babesia microti strain RI]|eukprot:XP_021338131.1 translation initiation factor eIF-5 [Babesia microti strain RI]
MAYVNIPRNRDDPNYRYKMPKIVSRIEGRGNGIKTNIANMGDISRALKRPPMYPTKFFGCELGAMAKFEESEEKALINGAHNERDLATILDKFIEMYVLCPNCQLPEIDVFVRKGSLVYSCNACGSQGTLDMTHKAATYMIKNPTDTKKKSKKTDKHSKVDKSEKDREKGDKDDVEGDKCAKEKRKKEKDRKKKSKTDISDDSLDSQAELVKKTQSMSITSTEKLNFTSPEIEDVIKRLDSIIERNGIADNELFVQELHMLQLSQDFDSKCRVYVAFSVLLGNDLSATNFEKNIHSFIKVVNNSVTAEDVLEALDFYYFNKDIDLTRNFPYIVQQLYNADIVKSSDIMRHYKKPLNDHKPKDSIKESKDYNKDSAKDSSNDLSEEYARAHEKCKKAVAPFLSWLEQMSESESDDDTENMRNPKIKSLVH